MNILSDFDFVFTGTDRADVRKDRAELLEEAINTVSGLHEELGGEPGEADATVAAASRLLNQLNGEVAEFSESPEVLRLEEKHFSKHGLSVPSRFTDLSKKYKFYWVRFPITLYPADGMHFNKLRCAVEFNPGVAAGHLRPCAQMILPDKKFKKLLELNESFSVQIGENFEFKASSGVADVEAKAAGSLGLVVGPFTYRLKRAQLDHSAPGAEKVFWNLDGAEFFQEEDPTLIVVLRVPKEVDQVKIAGALQAYHGFSLLAAEVGRQVISFFRKRVESFFHKGAPIQDLQDWDITPAL